MTFAEYFSKFTPMGIKRQINKDHAVNAMAASYMEHVYFILDVAAKDPVFPLDPVVDTTLLNQILIYSLYKLDRANFYLVAGKRNVNINSIDLINIMASDDPHMRTFKSDDVRREYVTVMVITTILYLMTMCKKVEVRTMLALSADLNKTTLMKAFDLSQDMLNDCRHFGRKAYDGKILNFLNHSRQILGSVKKHPRAF